MINKRNKFCVFKISEMNHFSESQRNAYNDEVICIYVQRVS